MTSVGNASAKVVNDVGNNVGNVGNDVGNVGEQFSEKSVEDSDLKASIMNLISADSKVLSSETAKQLSVSQRTVERHIKQLREDGQITTAISLYHLPRYFTGGQLQSPVRDLKCKNYCMY